MNVSTLAEQADVAWETAARYLDLCTYSDMTKEPRFSTAKKVFGALGYSILFGTKDAKGVVEL